MELRHAVQDAVEKGSDEGRAFCLRVEFWEHYNNPTYRLVPRLLESGEIALEDGSGDRYSFTMDDIDAADWNVCEVRAERRAA